MVGMNAVTAGVASKVLVKLVLLTRQPNSVYPVLLMVSDKVSGRVKKLHR